MDEIYRFRSIDRLLGTDCPHDSGELRSQIIYFAEASELNDPVEAIRDLVWLGDRIVWTNLFRHYLNCLHHICFLLRVTERDDPVGPGDIPINMRWDDPPSELYVDLLAEIWSDLDRQFDLAQVASGLEALGRRARSAEVEGYLTFLHWASPQIVEACSLRKGRAMPETRSSYVPEFRAGAVRIVLETGKPVAQVARDLGMHPGTLGNWVKAERGRGSDGPLEGDERAELVRLRTENAELRMERDVLKRSVVLWVKEATK